MPIKYRLVLRKDMTKGAAAGSKLYYAVNKSTGTCDFEELCDQIAAAETEDLQPSEAGFVLSSDGRPNIIFGVNEGHLAIVGMNY